MGPFRVGFFHGIFAALVAAFSNFFFVFFDPATSAGWALATMTDFLPLFALAAYIFLGILAALRASPVRIDPGVPYRSQVMRDAALAAVIVAVMAASVNLVSTGLQATVFRDEINTFASEAAPRIADYVNEAGKSLSDPPPPTSAGQVERLLQPPTLGDLGRALGNAAIGTMLLGAVGAGIGALRGRSMPDGQDVPEKSPGRSRDQKAD